MKNQAISRFYFPLTPEKRRSERGNVMFLILIAVVLFGALSFMMSQGSRTGAQSLTLEQSRLAATEIINYLNNIKQATDSLIIKGCDPLSIDFSNEVYTNNNGTVSDPAPTGADTGCTLFHPAGGGMRPETFDRFVTGPAGLPTEARRGHFYARYVDSGLGSDENDLAYLAHGWTNDICRAILGLARNTQSSEVPVANFTAGGNNSWAQGGAGALTPLTMASNSSRIFAVQKTTGGPCHAGIILRVN